MIRSFLRAAVHNATVTFADHAWPASVRIDPVILAAAAIQPLEEVELVNLTTGERVRTFVEAGESGEIRVHAGERQPLRAGDLVSILCYGLLHDGQTLAHSAKIVTLDGDNRIVSLSEAT